MTTGKINWHYPRTELAEQILNRFEIGATTALTLFAPRRMGKTEFLRYDLLPMAEIGKNYATVYVNFWDRMEDPTDSLLVGLQRAAQEMPPSAKLKRALKRFEGGSLDTPVGGASIQLAGQKSAEKLDLVQELFESIIEGRSQLLVALDEVQHLATSRSFEPLVYALRGIFDNNREVLRVIYTGSSRSGLQRLFRRRNAPLFSSSQQIELPELGDGYLQHMIVATQKASGRLLDLGACHIAFDKLKKVPYDYRQVIDRLILEGRTDIVGVAEEYLTENNDEEGYVAKWASLLPVDKAVLKLIVLSYPLGLYTQEARGEIAAGVGVESVEIGSVQNAVNRLKRESIIAPVSLGRYELEDPHFRDWLLDALETGGLLS